jgi:hypothetical protein
MWTGCRIPSNGHPFPEETNLILGSLQMLHKPEKIPVRIKREWRVLYRFFTAVVWSLLPLAGEKLDSLRYLSIITGTAYLCLFLEVFGQSPKGSTVLDWKNDWDTDGYQELHGGGHRMIRTIYGFF